MIGRTRIAGLSLALLAAATVAGGAPGGSAAGPDDVTDRVPREAAPRELDLRADSLVARWIEALGGMETFQDFRTARYTLTTELYDPATGRLRRARPRYVALAKARGEQLSRIERWTWDGSLFVVQAFDGDSAWTRVNGERPPPDHRDAEEALYVTRDVFYWFGLPFKLRDPGVNLHYDGRDGEGRHVVRVTFGEDVGEHQDVWWYLFEDGRAWPAEVRYQTDGVGTVNRLRFESIASSGGYFYPQRRVYVDEEDRVWKILRMSDVRLNPELGTGPFTDPSASPWASGERTARRDEGGGR